LIITLFKSVYLRVPELPDDELPDDDDEPPPDEDLEDELPPLEKEDPPPEYELPLLLDLEGLL
jgi:hypothetical protein